jgi:aryl-phospho-beta-D-glucosidase BglC (GH1 family)
MKRKRSLHSGIHLLLFIAFVSCHRKTELAVHQSPAIGETHYPNYNVSPAKPDYSGMNSTATQLATKMTIGWNLGNTLEAIGGETAWGNPKATKALITTIKQSGFNAVRIPCSWDQYADPATAKIRGTWLSRVKEVVQYCIDNNMYVILNIHWDGGWLENNCTPEKKDEVNAKQKAYWEQIATYLRDFDEHLIFASANEPAVANAVQMDVLLSYHQTFIDAVRSTGGRNAYRTLVVQGPSTDFDKTLKLMNKMPEDRVKNKLMLEVHSYTPYQFALMTRDEKWGNQFYYWGRGYHSPTDTTHNATWGEESDIDRISKAMKTKFIDNGIPVIIGEFGVIRRSSLTGDALVHHLDARAHYLEYFVKRVKANGLVPFYWDEGSLGNNSFGLFSRQTNDIADHQALDSLMRGTN